MWWPKQRISAGQLTRAQARQAEAEAAAEFLCRVHGGFVPLVQRYGLERPITTHDPFVALFGSILQQQISMAAAAAVLRRVKGLCPRGRLSARAIAELRPEQLRAAGLSRQKIVYVHDLARHFLSGEIAPAALRRMSDEEVIEHTSRVKGIGRWTAEMLLIFCLERPDVWPVDDLGLRKGAQRFFGLAEMPSARSLRPMGDPFQPYRSYATWYLWRSLEGPLMPGISLEKTKTPELPPDGEPARKPRRSAAGARPRPSNSKQPKPATRTGRAADARRRPAATAGGANRKRAGKRAARRKNGV